MRACWRHMQFDSSTNFHERTSGLENNSTHETPCNNAGRDSVCARKHSVRGACKVEVTCLVVHLLVVRLEVGRKLLVASLGRLEGSSTAQLSFISLRLCMCAIEVAGILVSCQALLSTCIRNASVMCSGHLHYHECA